MPERPGFNPEADRPEPSDAQRTWNLAADAELVLMNSSEEIRDREIIRKLLTAACNLLDAPSQPRRPRRGKRRAPTSTNPRRLAAPLPAVEPLTAARQPWYCVTG